MAEHVSYRQPTQADQTTTHHFAWVSIAGFVPDALKVKFEDVRPGDWVFDAWAERHKLTRARVLVTGELSIKREDFPTIEHVDNEERTIAIVPAHGWDKDKSVGYRKIGEESVGGRTWDIGEFYETCRCGETFGSGADGDESEAELRLRDHANTANGRELY